MTNKYISVIRPPKENIDAMLQVLNLLAELTGWKYTSFHTRKGYYAIRDSIIYSGNPFEVYKRHCADLLRHFKKLSFSKALPEAMLEMVETGGPKTYLYWCTWFQERDEECECRFFKRFVLLTLKNCSI